MPCYPKLTLEPFQSDYNINKKYFPYYNKKTMAGIKPAIAIKHLFFAELFDFHLQPESFNSKSVVS